MPVPTGPDNPAPRRLLRDVVFEKMIEAIQDGTLQAGERLNDDELVAWLGVSRTPIREAIAKLVDYGLVEMEANRYTRIVRPTFEMYQHAIQMLGGFHELSARWAFPRFTDTDVNDYLRLCDDALARLEARESSAIRALGALTDFTLERTGNPLLKQLEATLNARVVFMIQAALDEFRWVETIEYVQRLRHAAETRDHAAIIPAFEAFQEATERHLEAVHAVGVIPD
ncbi:GntR family transcriptional regulator [Frondihabitans peucedani]|uniref:GntR family transcriptional regulator n=1 Tax=Frondihabitans peucedani TaxID=598626 RepID=A0ABP8E1T5_9MICO